MILSILLSVTPVPLTSTPPEGPPRAELAAGGAARLVFGDVDGDGLQDILRLSMDGTFLLLRNQGEAGFLDVTVASGLGGAECATCGLMADLDADGALDLFLGSGRTRVWLNRGDGSFQPARPGIDHGAVDLSCVALDADADGLVDLHVATDAGDAFYRNLGAGTFAPVVLPGPSSVLVPVGAPTALDGSEEPASNADAARERLARWRMLVASATGNGGGPTSSFARGTPLVPLGPQAPAPAVGICAETLEDQATGACLEASSIPTVGRLYPMSTSFRVEPSGNVAIGSAAAAADLNITGPSNLNGHWMLGFSEGDQAPSFGFLSGFAPFGSENSLRLTSAWTNEIMVWKGNGAVGINRWNPASVLEIGTPPGVAPRIFMEGPSPSFAMYDRNQGREYTLQNVDNEFRIVDGPTGAPRLSIDAAGLVSVKQALEIRGGADIVERFDAGAEAAPGTVLIIDPEQPGQLVPSTEPYDSKVAGVVSGAGGVNPGLCLSQDGALDGDTLVAMSGRVFVKATAANGPIRPGDRLTTSSVAGHAMRVDDGQRSIGAVIGKAMGCLEEGEGLVLVLVNLQ